MNKSVLITGGTRGIGKQTVELFAEKGFNIAFTYFNSDDLALELQNNLIAKYPNILVQSFKADVASFQDMKNVGLKLKNTFGKLDVLVCNAGIDKIKQIIDCDEKDFDEVINCNLKGAFNTIKAVLPMMINQKQGKMVVVSSIWGIQGASCESIYSASKAGLIGLVKSLAKELGPSNINVNCVCPGLIETEMNGHLSNEDKQNIINETPLERIGLPIDVANAIYFLSSDQSNYITGQALTIDGGWMC